MTMTKLSDYYAVVLTSKWFYFSILATVLSYLLLDQWLGSFVQDYLQFGQIAEIQVPGLHLLYLICRYSIVLTEISILSWAWYTPVDDPKFADVLPAGVAWQRIWLQFEDDENVMITVGQYRRGASYTDMGMADKRGKTEKPNLQWQFLLLLAKKGGELSFKDSEADAKWVKQKELLSKKLKSYFRMDSDPFFPYINKYKIRLMLMAPKAKEAEVGRLSGQKPEAQAFHSHEVEENFESLTSQVNDTDETNEAWHESQGRTPRIRVWQSDE
jgi:hypothetical protein